MNRVHVAALLLLLLLPLAGVAGWGFVHVYLMPNPRELTPEQRYKEWRSSVRFVVGAFID